MNLRRTTTAALICVAAVAAILQSSMREVAAGEPTKPRFDAISSASPTPVAVGGETKARLLAALRTTAEALRSRSVEPAEHAAFIELLEAAEALRHDESVPQSERDLRRGWARGRLAEAADILRRQEKRAAAAAKNAPAISHAALADTHTLNQVIGVGGAAAVAPQNVPADVVESQKLIEIIVDAIRPETWDDNGGQGTIRYWSLGKALIIYNTADVHERVGGFAGQLRP